MDVQKTLEVLEKYRSFFKKEEILKKKQSGEKLQCFHSEILEHCHWMLDEISKLIFSGKLGRAQRWLGFVQGCLWTTGIFSIKELREHNRIE